MTQPIPQSVSQQIPQQIPQQLSQQLQQSWPLGMFPGQSTMFPPQESSFSGQSSIANSVVNDNHNNSSTEHRIVNQLPHPNASLPPAVSAPSGTHTSIAPPAVCSIHIPTALPPGKPPDERR